MKLLTSSRDPAANTASSSAAPDAPDTEDAVDQTELGISAPKDASETPVDSQHSAVEPPVRWVKSLLCACACLQDNASSGVGPPIPQQMCSPEVLPCLRMKLLKRIVALSREAGTTDAAPASAENLVSRGTHDAEMRAEPTDAAASSDFSVLPAEIQTMILEAFARSAVSHCTITGMQAQSVLV